MMMMMMSLTLFVLENIDVPLVKDNALVALTPIYQIHFTCLFKIVI